MCFKGRIRVPQVDKREKKSKMGIEHAKTQYGFGTEFIF